METDPGTQVAAFVAKATGLATPLLFQAHLKSQTPELMRQTLGRTLAYTHGMATGADQLDPELPVKALRSFVQYRTNLNLPTSVDIAAGAATGSLACVDLIRNETNYPLIGSEGLLPRLADGFRVAAAASAPHAIHSLLRLAEYASYLPDIYNTAIGVDIALNTGVAAVGLLQITQSSYRQILRPTGRLINQAISSAWSGYQESRAQARAARREARRATMQAAVPATLDQIQHTSAQAAKHRTTLGL